jgi:hypothetical protein
MKLKVREILGANNAVGLVVKSERFSPKLFFKLKTFKRLSLQLTQDDFNDRLDMLNASFSNQIYLPEGGLTQEEKEVRSITTRNPALLTELFARMPHVPESRGAARDDSGPTRVMNFSQ